VDHRHATLSQRLAKRGRRSIVHHYYVRACLQQVFEDAYSHGAQPAQHHMIGPEIGLNGARDWGSFAHGEPILSRWAVPRQNGRDNIAMPLSARRYGAGAAK